MPKPFSISAGERPDPFPYGYESNETLTEEEARERIRERVLDPDETWNGSDLTRLGPNLKYNFTNNLPEGWHWKPEDAESRFRYLLRGQIAERVNGLTPISEGKIVFAPKDNSVLEALAHVDIISQQHLGANSSKAGLLRTAIELSHESPETTSAVFRAGDLAAQDAWQYIQSLSDEEKKKQYLDNYSRQIGFAIRQAREAKDKYKDEVVTGFSEYKANKRDERGKLVDDPGSEMGIYQIESTIPDGFLRVSAGESFQTQEIVREEVDTILGEGKTAYFEDPSLIIGLTEVKGYTPDDFELWLVALEAGTTDDILVEDLMVTITSEDKDREVLGMNLQKQKNFLQIWRNNMGADNIDEVPEDQVGLALLRFPSDIPDEQLQRLGKIARDLGHTNLVIQKLPFTSGELDQLGAEALIRGLEKSNNGKGVTTFKKRELKLLENITGAALAPTE